MNLDNYLQESEPKQPLSETKNYIIKFYRTSLIQNDYKPDLDLSDAVSKAIKTCYDVRKNEIFQALAKECILRKGHNLVENYDWKLKWILGSSDLAIIKEPILQVHLHYVQQENAAIKKRTLNFEANLEKVDELIQALTKVKKELELS